MISSTTSSPFIRRDGLNFYTANAICVYKPGSPIIVVACPYLGLAVLSGLCPEVLLVPFQAVTLVSM
jgi:hypothetical protein